MLRGHLISVGQSSVRLVSISSHTAIGACVDLIGLHTAIWHIRHTQVVASDSVIACNSQLS